VKRPHEKKSAIREVEPGGANCMNCRRVRETGGDKCPVHGTKADARHVCDNYKPGLM
jgi:hypothetical protein